MSKKVVWTSLASNSLSDIHDYYSLRASTTVANRIVRRILGDSSKLLSNPQIGQIEIFLKGRQFEYRYLIVGNYKLIYRVSEKSNAIVILDVFDTRRSPGKMSVEED